MPAVEAIWSKAASRASSVSKLMTRSYRPKRALIAGLEPVTGFAELRAFQKKLLGETRLKFDVLRSQSPAIARALSELQSIAEAAEVGPQGEVLVEFDDDMVRLHPIAVARLT